MQKTQTSLLINNSYDSSNYSITSPGCEAMIIISNSDKDYLVAGYLTSFDNATSQNVAIIKYNSTNHIIFINKDIVNETYNYIMIDQLLETEHYYTLILKILLLSQSDYFAYVYRFNLSGNIVSLFIRSNQCCTPASNYMNILQIVNNDDIFSTACVEFFYDYKFWINVFDLNTKQM